LRTILASLLIFVPLGTWAQQTLKVNVDLVNVFLSAQDSGGGFVTDLTRDDFTVFDDGQPQKISIFEKQNDVRSAIAVLLDTSGSMVDIIPYERRGAADFIKTIRYPDESYVITFGTTVHMVHRSPQDSQHLDKELQSLKAFGTSLLFDAMLYGMDKVNSSENERKALVIFSDGNDNGSNIEYRRVVEESQISGILLYFVAIGSPVLVDRNTVESLSAASGGRVFYVPKGTNVGPYLEQIRAELAKQYYLGYYITRTPGFHRIKVDVSGRSDVRLRTKSGYLVK